jgi:hypothetical protein
MALMGSQVPRVPREMPVPLVPRETVVLRETLVRMVVQAPFVVLLV